MNKFLVVNGFTAKSGDCYVSGHFWSDQYKKWTDSKKRDGSYGPSLLPVSADQLSQIIGKIDKGLVVDVDVDGYDGSRPIWKIVKI